MVTNNPATLDALRRSLLAMMSDWSEGAYASGWMSRTEEMLHAEGGTWEILGRAIGWPTAYEEDENFAWVTWDEAGELFEERKRQREALRKSVTGHWPVKPKEQGAQSL